MKLFTEELAAACWNDDVVQLVAVIESMTAQLFWSSCESNLLQFVAFSESVCSDSFHAGRYINVIQFITIIECIMFNLLHRTRDDDMRQLFLATESHLSDNLYSLRNRKTGIMVHVVNQALLVGGIDCLAVKLKVIAVNLL